MVRVTMFVALEKLLELHREAEASSQDISREFPTEDGLGYRVTTKLADCSPSLLMMQDAQGDAPIARIAARMILVGALC